jgi:SAM-dependent methyltransferase
MRWQEIIPLSLRKALGDRWHSWQAAKHRKALLRKLAGDNVQCNVCGWKGLAFTDDLWHKGTICPNCGSQVRHRMLAAAFDGLAGETSWREERLLRGKRLLHFAPERQLRDRLGKVAAVYQTADFERGDCDLMLDISSMPKVGTGAFDVIIACDVLEHVPDDRAAFREIHRVLSQGGWAVLTVPQKDPPAETDEDPTVERPDERLARFGQPDHVRMYGDDFNRRLEEAGFTVQVVDTSKFLARDTHRHVLHPPEANPSPLATNHRRIYFCQKSQNSEPAN